MADLTTAFTPRPPLSRFPLALDRDFFLDRRPVDTAGDARLGRLRRDRFPTLLGAVLGVRAIPMLLLAPLSGVVADRFDRRHALAASQFLMVVISIALAALLARDAVQVWHLFAFSVLAGVGAVFDRTLRNTLVFTSVPRNEVANAVALNSIAFSVTRAVGPGVADT